MYDKELALEILRQIEEAADKIIVRFASIRQASDFVEGTAGVDKLDAICMMLIVIGESLKNLDKITGGDLLRNYPQVDWKKAKGMRDILTHHYADINAEAVFHTCRDKIPQLLQTIKIIRNDQEKETGLFLEQQ
ncbi:DUF86 domain-containing protein [Desulfoprunum benzoelyticum]|uniref:Uncharacterized protein with HEPN domain n=1 Tax=Desulfoprunum benzoelyticum TaxID=1506996 RepID=A0A840V0P3_9BACT|nr:HepT-like ribonuclease domain-containing protein [Desulfoprunum benzoelyticum]MBB5346781.1 uncharacterized protein with HEPN domain [Desulfoprunum benzoelyticum]MBM9531527.1 DUF86 domain-containing protein [Desulfoprunum benzoelyticum]